jgi:hypothetical protein
MKRSTLVLAALALLLGGVGRAKADYIATVTLDTTVLTNNPSQGPFSVDFVFADHAGGIFLNNNTVTISNFNLHGGSLTSGTTITDGSVIGDLNSGRPTPSESPTSSGAYARARCGFCGSKRPASRSWLSNLYWSRSIPPISPTGRAVCDLARVLTDQAE